MKEVPIWEKSNLTVDYETPLRWERVQHDYQRPRRCQASLSDGVQ